MPHSCCGMSMSLALSTLASAWALGGRACCLGALDGGGDGGDVDSLALLGDLDLRADRLERPVALDLLPPEEDTDADEHEEEREVEDRVVAREDVVVGRAVDEGEDGHLDEGDEGEALDLEGGLILGHLALLDAVAQHAQADGLAEELDEDKHRGHGIDDRVKGEEAPCRREDADAEEGDEGAVLRVLHVGALGEDLEEHAVLGGGARQVDHASEHREDGAEDGDHNDNREKDAEALAWARTAGDLLGEHGHLRNNGEARRRVWG